MHILSSQEQCSVSGGSYPATFAAGFFIGAVIFGSLAFSSSRSEKDFHLACDKCFLDGVNYGINDGIKQGYSTGYDHGYADAMTVHAIGRPLG